MRHAPALLFCLLLAAPVPGQDAPVEPPFLRVRMHDTSLVDDARVQALWRELIADETIGAKIGSGLATAERIAKALAPPWELAVVVERGPVFSVGLLLRPSAPRLSALVTEGETGIPARDDGTVTFEGSSFRVLRFGGERDSESSPRLLEGDWKGRRLVLFVAKEGAAVDDVTALSAFVASLGKQSPAARRLEERLPGKGLEVAVLFDPVVSALEGMEWPATMVKTVLTAAVGPRCGGFCVSTRGEGGRIVQEVFADIRPGEGIVGGFLRREPRVPSLLAWLPKDTREVVSLDLDMRGVGGMLKALGALGLGAEDQEAMAWIAELGLPDFLEEHLTGEIAFVSRPSTPEAAADPDAEEPMVFLFGTPDGAAMLKALGPLLAGLDESLRVVAPAEERQFHALQADDEVLFHLVPRGSLLAVAGTDAESQAILRAVLATEGKGGPPARLTERLGVDEAAQPSTLLALSHVMSEFSGQVMMRDLRGKALPRAEVAAFARILDKSFGGAKGLSATRAVVDRNGLRVRTVL